MFTDMKISDDLNKKFGQFLEKNNTDVGISFSLLVLQVSWFYAYLYF